MKIHVFPLSGRVVGIIAEDDRIALWESNAILFYMASKRPQSGVWPSDLEGQADVLRWLFWESLPMLPAGNSL